MPIETVEDVIEEVANIISLYGAHDETCAGMKHGCRNCFTSALRGRLNAAYEVERKLDLTSPASPKTWHGGPPNYDTNTGHGCDECGNSHGDAHSKNCTQGLGNGV